MVCNRCIMAVQKLLEDSGFITTDVQLGEVTIQVTPDEAEKKQLQDNLKKLGFELITQISYTRIIQSECNFT